MRIEVPIIIFIMAIPIYFISKWLINKRKTGDDSNRKYLAVISTIILAPVFYMGIVIIWTYSLANYPSIDFNQKEWKSNAEERYKMSKDIIESKMLIGKTRDEVIEILGTDYTSNSKDKLTYELGVIPGLFNIDPDYLIIKFTNDKVISITQNY